MIKHIPQTKNQYLNQGGILDAYYQPLLLDLIFEALARTINKEKQRHKNWKRFDYANLLVMDVMVYCMCTKSFQFYKQNSPVGK